MEEIFGISQFLGGSAPAIPVVFKRLYSDFVVREILTDGSIAGMAETEDVEAVEEVHAETGNEPTCALSAEQRALVEGMTRDDPRTMSIPVKEMSKTDRTAVHSWIRWKWGDQVDSVTANGSIELSWTNASNRYMHLKQYGHCQEAEAMASHTTGPLPLHAEQGEQGHAIRGEPARTLPRVPPPLSSRESSFSMKTGNVGVAGAKDRRGVTHQRASVWRVESRRLRELNSRLRGIRLTDFKYEAHAITLGQLRGNHFSIILRNIEAAHVPVLNSRLEDFPRRGFINYYGSQRFGSCKSNTADIGRAILQGDFHTAVQLILSPQLAGARENEDCLSRCLSEWQTTGDARTALKLLEGSQRFAGIESQVLRCLTRDGNNFRDAIMSLPRNSRSLYLHAYQSLVWNRVVSRRIAQFGSAVLEGDLLADASIVSDISLHSLDEVHMPLPSANMQLPRNEVGSWYDEELKKDAITRESFATLQGHFALGDVTRSLIVVPRSVQFSWLRYSHSDSPLQAGLDGIEPVNEDNGQLIALRLQFALSSGCYATMALRELTHGDLSKNAQCANAIDGDDQGEGE